MQPARRYHWDTPEYADAFAALLRASGERAGVHQFLRGVLSGYPADSRAIDWGAGGGRLTALLLEHFRHVYAVEPNPELRAALARNCPAATVLAGTVMSVAPPTPVEVGLLSHVLYHVPDHKWGAHVVRAADHLSRDGVLLVLLLDPDAGTNRMLEHFGAPRFDLYRGLADVVRRHREFDFCFARGPGGIRTTSFDETLQIARFVLCDRDEDAFARPPTEAAFQEYVRAHFWDEQAGAGGWPYDVVFCSVRRSALPDPR
jgi:SAM-dependent methyltransferase